MRSYAHRLGLTAAFALALLRPTPTALAVDPPPAAENVRFELQGIALAVDVAGPLIAQGLDPARAEAAYHQVQALLESGQGSIVAWTMSISKSGEVARVSTIRDIHFPLGEEVPSNYRGRMLNGRVFGGFPEIFQVEARGISLEVTGTPSDGASTIALEFHVRNVALNPSDEITDKAPELPELDGTVLPADMIVQNGQHIFLGAFRNPATPGKLNLFFLRAELRDPRKPRPPPATQ